MTRLIQKFQSVAAFNRELERISKRWDYTPSATGSLVLSKEDLPDSYKRTTNHNGSARGSNGQAR